MAFYRLYCLDKGKLITSRVEFDADDDLAAIAYARHHHEKSDCEIWELGRKVALVPAHGPVKRFGPPDEPGGLNWHPVPTG